VTGLKFCFLTTFYPPHNFGGDGIGVQRLARGLVRRGTESRWCTMWMPTTCSTGAGAGGYRGAGRS
jgi:hypothetical protein